jgi:hypothetical protein
MTHKVYIMTSFAKAILDGDKTFEIRENDRGYQKGDILHFIPVDDLSLKDWGMDEFDAEITYVLSGWGLKEGYVALGIKVIRDT